MINFCILDTNDIIYSDNDLMRLTIDTLEYDIEDILNIEYFDASDSAQIAHKIHNIINPPKGSQIYTTIISESEDVIYEMCHINLIDDDTLNKEVIKTKKNMIANSLCNNLYDIYSKCIIMKFKLIDNIPTSDTINKTDIYNIIKSKHIHNLVCIKTDESFEDIQYMGCPTTVLKINNLSEYKYFEKEIFGKILMFFVYKNPPNTINKNATRLYDSHQVIHGDVFIAMREKPKDITQINNIYNDINKEFINKLLIILNNPSLSFMEEPPEFNKETGKYYNIYHILNKKYNESHHNIVEKTYNNNNVLNYE